MSKAWREWRWVLGTAGLVLAGANVLYGWAYLNAAPDTFGGVLLNPVDGATYLAKMREGWRGAWLFTLPYTATPGSGAFLYAYYLFLGHVARWLNVSLELVYHTARVASGFFFLLTAYHFIARFVADVSARRRVWLMFALGSGLGWLALPTGHVTADFWVAEAFPFLTLFSNAHFSLAWALLLWLLEWTLPGLAPPPTAPHLVRVALAVSVLAQVQPLALVNLSVMLGAMTMGRAFFQRRWLWPEWKLLLTAGLAAGPWLAYTIWVTQTNTLLVAWMKQGATPSPALWDAVLSGGLALALAVVGLKPVFERFSEHNRILAYWLILSILMLCLPLSFQRRLSLGIWMPLVLLAWRGWREVIAPRLNSRARFLALSGLAVLLPLTNGLVLLSTASAIQRHAPALYLTAGETRALQWLDENADGQLVLAAPELSLHIPARSDARVVYGHPMETVNAAERKQAVLSFYRDELATTIFLDAQKIDYIVHGPRERALGPLPPVPGWRAVFQAEDVTVYGREQ